MMNAPRIVTPITVGKSFVLIACTVLGWLATFLPENVIRKIPLALIWLLPIVAMVPLAWALMPFWTKG